MKIALMALCAWMSVAAQSESLEKRALLAVQQLPASSLDSKLPDRPFIAWLSDLVGQETGVEWQLAECGGSAMASEGGGQEVQACAEAVVALSPGRRMILDIWVGTFKRVLAGDPYFLGAVIESDGVLYQVRRLSDLSWALRSPKSIPRQLPDPQNNYMPALVRASVTNPPPATPPLDGKVSAPRILGEDESPPPPPPQQGSQRGAGDFVEAAPISKAKPIYPVGARKMNVSGKVEVRVVISERGRVIEATAISGHMTLRTAAEDAARQWVYKAAKRNGVYVKTEAVLTFTFEPGVQ
jgi:TonB family protein